MKHFDNIINYSILFAFIAISILIAPYHEPWADEIQAFLIARDASFWEIISVIPHQEAQPPLWHLFLKSMIIIFGKDLNITYISIFIMSLTVGIFVFKYKIPLIYKILIPFGHSFLYQYNIISRNYCLAIFAIVLFGLLYKDRHKYIWRYSFILIFLAYTTSFYAPIAFCFGLLWILEIYFQHKNNIKKYILPVLTLAMFGIILLWQIFPIENAAINIRVTFDYHKHYNILAHTFDALFIGNNKIINLLFLVIISLYLIINNKFYQMIVNNKLNCIYIILILGSFFTIYLYSKYLFYHQGLLYTLLLILIYIFNKAMKINLLLVAILCMQIFWSVEIIKYDIKEN